MKNKGKSTSYRWVNKYAPRDINDVILPTRLKNIFINMVKREEIQPMLLSGSPGCGKTTIAKVLPLTLGWESMIINTSDENGIKLVRSDTVKNYCMRGSRNGKPKFLIFDECDGMSPQLQAALRKFMEDYPRIIFIFTANTPQNLHTAISESRLEHIHFDFTEDDIKSMYKPLRKRIFQILKKEDVEIEDKKSVRRYIKNNIPDLRNMIKSLQTNAIANMYTQKDGTDKLRLPKNINHTSNQLSFEALLETMATKDHKEYYKYVSRVSIHGLLPLVEDNLDKFNEPFDVIALINQCARDNADNFMKEAILVEFLKDLSEKIELE